MANNDGNSLISAVIVKIIAAFTIIFVVIIGIGLGLSLAETSNIKKNENFIEFAPALPTRLLDINGALITEFASDEKRELVSLSELPRYLIHAVLAREDPDFYTHRGFSMRGIARAAVGQLTGRNLGGGSTITQQVAGTLYTNRREISYKRKIKELWWSFQIERRYTKNEILEIYLNYMPMGPGTFGVETASKYFFKHSAKDITLAEAAALAVLLSGPTRFDPLRNPNLAMNRQHFVLERMIQFGYVDKDEAEASFTEYWENFDWTQPALSAYLTREDRAPWFSEYVRRELDVLMYGSMDYYRDGYVVHTTLDLEHQAAAEKFFAEGLEKANRDYIRLNRRSNVQAERIYTPIVDLLTLAFDLTDIRNTASGQNEMKAVSRYTRTINPVVDMAAMAFGIPELKDVTGKAFAMLRETTEQNVVEGALINIENETGYITAIIGGSKYDESNQFIRATQGIMQPGSAFKPLYYSAAIDTRKFNASSLIYDIPVVFHNEDSSPYIPYNYGGVWRGPVLLYNVLSLSLNIPSLKILDVIGFDAAIERAAALMDITDPSEIRRNFPRVYSLGLGVNSASPLRLARAFAVFGNQGRSVTPIAIRMVEDRNGRVVFDVERELRQKQRRMGDNIQVVSPQNAYVMTKLMEKTVESGTLAYGAGRGTKFTFRDENDRPYRMQVAGKSGTTQNWSDAWAVGYTSYYTTAVWYGFDKPGNSLGVEVTGATLAGPVWGDFTREIHKDLPRKNFPRPSSGIIDVVVCIKSGLLRTSACNEGEIALPFLDGTVPHSYCEIHGGTSPFQTRIPVSTIPLHGVNEGAILDSLKMPQLPPGLELQESQRSDRNQNPDANAGNTTSRNTRRNQSTRNTANTRNTRNSSSRNSEQAAPLYNPLLDDDLPSAQISPQNPFSRPFNAEPPASADIFQDDIFTFIPSEEDDGSFFDDDADFQDELPSWNPLLE
ncbi:MAG: PBP1A family penicillin-binding protein [Treponema sp.]|jgi:penicillin-binding protein 1A|nr:PBP1A family penicillin-binding protein [Treponema sp.]